MFSAERSAWLVLFACVADDVLVWVRTSGGFAKIARAHKQKTYFGGSNRMALLSCVVARRAQSHLRFPFARRARYCPRQQCRIPACYALCDAMHLLFIGSQNNNMHSSVCTFFTAHTPKRTRSSSLRMILNGPSSIWVEALLKEILYNENQRQFGPFNNIPRPSVGNHR